MTLTIRPVAPRDYAPLAEIFSHYVRETTVSLSAVEKDAATMGAYFEARAALGRGSFVAEEGAEILGYATYDQFRPNDGYRHTMEHTVMLTAAAAGRGAGRALMQAVEDHARAAGQHVLVGAITADNAASIGFHQAIGFEIVARMPQVGRKFDRWHDLVIMQKIL
ncbi:GNAT family N-acetyltransferase [Pseudooceanicola sp. 200-1SW]|uniref:GNAT family N-acetyltransferase n=1 Tax=Pseudooceanicola sp. 200-1SW TaxID=3425949 RepID=UPI003D7FDB5B